MTTAISLLLVPVDLLDDLIDAELRSRAAARLAVYAGAYRAHLAGRPPKLDALARDAGLGRSAAFEVAARARAIAAADESRTKAGLEPDESRTPGVGATSASSRSAGRKPDESRTKAGRRPDSASARRASPDESRTPGVGATSASSRSAGRKPDDAGSDDRSIDHSPLPHEDQQEDQIDHATSPTTAPAEQAALFEPPTSAEGRRFVAVLRRWSSAPTAAPLRWRVDIGADLAWFNEEVLGDPDLVALDLIDALTRWNDWLETQHREKAAGRGGKFPKNWKTSLRNALRFQRENRRPPAPRPGADHDRNAPRGAFDGATQRFDVPIVTGSADDGHLDGWDDA